MKLGSGDPYNWLTAESSSSLNLSADMVEVSDKEVDWKKYIAGYKGATIDVTVYADETDAAQKAVIKGIFKGEELEGFIGVLGSNNTPSEGDAFKALVASVGETYDTGSAIARSISLQVTGAMTHYPAIS